MAALVENHIAAASVVEEELQNLAEVRTDPPARAGIREMLPQANGDQDTW